MALIWCDGFTGYGSANNSAPSPSGIIGAKYRDKLQSEDRQDVLIDGGRITGDCLELENVVYDWIMRADAMTSNNIIIAGIAYYITDASNTSKESLWPILSFTYGSNVNINLFLGDNKSIAISDNNENILGFASVTLPKFDWSYIEMKVYHHSSDGTVEVRVNSCPVLVLTSINTVTSGNTSNVCAIGSTSDRYDTDESRICDFYVCDGSGSKNNDFLGPVTVDTLFPDGDDTTEFDTTGNGNYTTHYEQINGKDALWDTDYIEDNTTGNQDIFTYQDTQNFATVHGVIGWTVASYNSTSTTYKMLCESNGSNSTSANISPGEDFQTDKFILEDDPDTSNAWTSSTINAMKFGLEIQ